MSKKGRINGLFLLAGTPAYQCQAGPAACHIRCFCFLPAGGIQRQHTHHDPLHHYECPVSPLRAVPLPGPFPGGNMVGSCRPQARQPRPALGIGCPASFHPPASFSSGQYAIKAIMSTNCCRIYLSIPYIDKNCKTFVCKFPFFCPRPVPPAGRETVPLFCTAPRRGRAPGLWALPHPYPAFLNNIGPILSALFPCCFLGGGMLEYSRHIWAEQSLPRLCFLQFLLKMRRNALLRQKF